MKLDQKVGFSVCLFLEKWKQSHVRTKSRKNYIKQLGLKTAWGNKGAKDCLGGFLQNNNHTKTTMKSDGKTTFQLK